MHNGVLVELVFDDDARRFALSQAHNPPGNDAVIRPDFSLGTVWPDEAGPSRRYFDSDVARCSRCIRARRRELKPRRQCQAGGGQKQAPA